MSNLASPNSPASLFISCLWFKDFGLMAEVLADEGEFQGQDDELEVVEMNKKEYLKWLELKLQTTIYDVSDDRCVSCVTGQEVYLINHGYWPRIPINGGEREIAALAFEQEKGKITEIRFCYVMLQSPNRYVFERKTSFRKWFREIGMDKDLMEYMLYGHEEYVEDDETGFSGYVNHTFVEWPLNLLIHPSHDKETRNKLLLYLRDLMQETPEFFHQTKQLQKDDPERMNFVRLLKILLNTYG